MSTYQSKFITFLSHGNTIIIESDWEFNQLKERMACVGIDLFSNWTFENLVRYAKENVERHGDTYELGNKIIVEFNNGRGGTIGWKSIEESEDWFGEKPFTWDEIREEL